MNKLFKDLAFPLKNCDIGMFLIDYFAAKAMQKIIGHETTDDTIKSWLNESGGKRNGPELIAYISYQFADAMMEEREKRINNK